MEIIVGIIVTVIGGIALLQLTKLLERQQTSKIELRKAPRNVLQHIAPGISVERAKEILGVPYREREGRLTYKFSNVLIEIQSKGRSVSTITLLLRVLSKANVYEVPWIGKNIGAVTLADVLESGDGLYRDTSSKHGQVWTECYFGYPGMYHYYTFGLFAGPVGAFEGNFPSMDDLKDPTTLKLKANYVSIASEAGDGAFFDFWAMV